MGTGSYGLQLSCFCDPKKPVPVVYDMLTVPVIQVVPVAHVDLFSEAHVGLFGVAHVDLFL